MAITDPAGTRRNLIDKSDIRRALEESDALTGFEFDPSATPADSRRLMKELGIRAEDREFLNELLRMRYGMED